MNKFNYACTYAYVHGASAVKSGMNKLQNRVKAVAADESGMEIIAIILILVVVIGLVILFKDYIFQLFENIWNSIFEDASSITGP